MEECVGPRDQKLFQLQVQRKGWGEMDKKKNTRARKANLGI